MIRNPVHLLVATAITLIVAVAATAVATPTTLQKAVTKSMVKRIAVKQADKRVKALAPKLEVAGAQTAADADKLGGRPPASYADADTEPVHIVGSTGEPAFENGWVNAGPQNTSAGFYADGFGQVHLQGTLTAGGGGNGNVAFTLPAGYRPDTQVNLPAVSFSGLAARVNITPEGNVRPTCDDSIGCGISIDGAIFRLDN